MNFASALISLRRGHKIKRHHWEGYWYLDNNEVIMHTFDNQDINIRDSEDILYTLDNIACNDWEICDNDHAEKELVKKEFTKPDIVQIKNIIDTENPNSVIAQYINKRDEDPDDWLKKVKEAAYNDAHKIKENSDEL